MMRATFGALLLVAACATAGGAQSADTGEPLRPGDVVTLRIWGDTLLDARFTVDERGYVVLPRIGARDVGSMTPAALRAALVAEYTRMLAREPAIEVLTFRRIVVLGAVRQPGAHHLPTGQTTLSDALGAAGGLLPEGRRDRVQVTRAGALQEHRLTPGEGLTAIVLQSGDQVFVPERPWLARNQAVLATVISGAVSVLVTLLIVAGGS